MSLGMLRRELAGRLRHGATAAYLGASAELTRRRLAERAGARNFEQIVIVAALGKNNGIATGARLQYEWLIEEGFEVKLIDATAALRNPFHRISHRPGTAYILHCGGPQTTNLIASVLPEAATAYRIGYWAWELPDPAADWAGCDRAINEIWTPSAFSAASLGKLSGLPIHVVPHRVRPRPARTRGAGPFTVLAMADSRSSFTRKNPDGACRAFNAAFATSRDARLILKLCGRDEEIGAFERSLGELTRANVTIVRGHLDPDALEALYDETDAFVSLHRAEGFGLPMLEAMVRGIPVVATGWSGNLEFMREADGLVPYRLVPVVDDAGIYHSSVWAEPDIAAAASLLRRLADDAVHYAHAAGAARRTAQDRPRPFPPSADTMQVAAQ